MNFVVLLLSITVTSIAQADEKVELYADCGNYCSFQEFGDQNCHGIAFKVTDDKGGVDFLYTHATDEGCVYDRIPHHQSISRAEVSKACSCAGIERAAPLPEKTTPMSADTKIKLEALKAKIKSWVVCAPDPLTIQPKNLLHPFGPKEVDSCEAMKARGEQPYLILGGCSDAHPENCGYYGNTNNYSGPLCFAGDMDRCDEVKKSQDPVTGAWYRSAYQRRFPLSERGQPLFSRDEFIGVMLYLIKTNDKEAAEKWLRFLDQNPEKNSSLLGPLNKITNICPPLPPRTADIPDSNWKQMVPDDRCEMRPDSWGLMYRVYQKLGFSDSDLKKVSRSLFWAMRLATPLNSIVSDLSTRTVKDVGYEQGDQATNILALQAIGLKDDSVLKDSANQIDSRSGYESPYYHYLAEEGPTEYGARLILKYCPAEIPVYGNTSKGQGIPNASFFDFGVHYFGGVQDGWQIVLPTGHECVGWIDLYTGQ